MPNRNKQKGDRFERATLLAALPYFPEAKRTRAGWDEDRGDVLLDPNMRFIAQSKDCQSKPWFVWLDELDLQLKHSGALHGAIVSKRPGVSDAGGAMAVMRFDNWLKMASELNARIGHG